MTDALPASPAVDRQLLGVELAPVDVAHFRFADRTSGQAGGAYALLQGIQLLRHLSQIAELKMCKMKINLTEIGKIGLKNALIDSILSELFESCISNNMPQVN